MIQSTWRLLTAIILNVIPTTVALGGVLFLFILILWFLVERLINVF